MKKNWLFAWLLLIPGIVWGVAPRLDADGVLVLDGQRRFIIGCYHNPMTAAGLEELAQNGFNLVHCAAKTEALDLTQQAGLYAWINTGYLIDFSTDAEQKAQKLTTLVKSFQSHPALAVWEAPDEALWGLAYPHANRPFYSDTATVALQEHLLQEFRKNVVRASKGFAQGVQQLKQLDPARPVWFNHAPRNSLEDLKLFSQPADIVGCDIYPVHEGLNGHSDFINNSLSCVGEYTDFMQAAAPKRPVWMVLQAFSWDLLKDPLPETPEPRTFPTWNQSRFMAYNAILHGAKGILYWGSHYVGTNSLFRKSLLAVTREIAALEPFWVAPGIGDKLKLEVIQLNASHPTRVAATLRQAGDDYLLIVLQEDMGHPVEVSNLKQLEKRTLYELGTGREYVVTNGKIRVWHSLEPHVLCTSQKYETVLATEFPKIWEGDALPLSEK